VKLFVIVLALSVIDHRFDLRARNLAQENYHLLILL
jgi:hypothetical protein